MQSSSTCSAGGPNEEKSNNAEELPLPPALEGLKEVKKREKEGGKGGEEDGEKPISLPSDDSPSSLSPPSPLFPSWRFLLATMLFLGNVICYADRTNMSVAIDYIEDFPKSASGWLLASFYVGYFCTQILGGKLTVRYGGKPVLICAVLIWTFFDLSTLTADVLIPWGTGGVVVLCLLRVGMGLGEGFCFPSEHAMSGLWVPVQERGRLVSYVCSGMDMGAIVSLYIAPLLIDFPGLGWRSLFIFWGLIAILWVSLFALTCASRPEHHKKAVNSGEASFIVATRGAGHDGKGGRLPSYFHPALLAIYSMHFCGNYMGYVLGSWLPIYFTRGLKFDMTSQPWLLPMPFFASWVGGLMSGWFADFLVARGVSVSRTRKFVNSIGAFVAAGALLVTALFCKDPSSATVGMCITMFLKNWSTPGYWANMVDVSPTKAGEVMGFSNTIATIPGVIGNVITQFILDSTNNSWTAVFLVPAGVSVVGGVIFNIWSEGESIELEVEGGREEGEK